MRQYILLFALAAIAEAYFGSERLHTRDIFPRGSPRSRSDSPKTQASAPVDLQPLAASRPTSPQRPRPISPARVTGVLDRPGQIVTNTHPTQGVAHAQFFPSAKQIHAQGSSIAMVSTTSHAGSVVGASGSHAVRVALQNGPNTEACVTCALPDGLHRAYVRKDSEASFHLKNVQSNKRPIMVSVRQTGPGTMTAVGINKTSRQEF